MKKLPALLLFIALLASCATYKTVSPKAQSDLVQYVASIEDEACVTIPRVYSGLAYTCCVMSGDITLQSIHYELALVSLDLVADTILLPYTIYRQSVDGNLVIKKASR